MHTTFSYKFLLCLALTYSVHVYNPESSLQVINWRRIVVSVHVCLCVAVRKHMRDLIKIPCAC